MKHHDNIETTRIPQARIDNMARPVLEAVRKVFDDPKVAAEYEQWLAARRAKKGATA